MSAIRKLIESHAGLMLLRSRKEVVATLKRKKIRHSLIAVVPALLLATFLAPSLAADPSDHATPSQELHVAAADEMNPALVEVARAFEKKSGIHVDLTFGSSTLLYSKIRNNVAFDAFFSADMDQARKMVSSGDAVSLTQYARDGLALCISPLSAVPVSPRNPLAVLRDKVVSHIAVADARKTTVGRATVQALRKASVYDLTVRRKLIVGDNVAETAQFVERGEADVALLPTSAIRTNSLPNVRVIKLSPSLYQPILMGAVVIRRTRNRQEAVAFVNFAASPSARSIFRRYGFSAY